MSKNNIVTGLDYLLEQTESLGSAVENLKYDIYMSNYEVQVPIDESNSETSKSNLMRHIRSATCNISVLRSTLSIMAGRLESVTNEIQSNL